MTSLPQHAVENGVLQRLSVSQLKNFDPTLDEGCERSWYFRKVLRLPSPGTFSQALGTALHEIQENWLKTGQDTDPPADLKDDALETWWKALDLAKRGRVHLPEPGPDLLTECSFGDVGLDAGGIPLEGYIDLVNPRNPKCPGIGDHKTTSSIADWAKSEEELGDDYQMLGYGEWALRRFPEAEVVDLAHFYYQTKRRPDTSLVQISLPADTIRQRWLDKTTTLVGRMKDVAKESDFTKVPMHQKACGAYGGCPFKSKCFANPLERMKMGLLDRVKKTPPSTPPAAEAPPPVAQTPPAPPPAPPPGPEGLPPPAMLTKEGYRYSPQQQDLLGVDELGVKRKKLVVEETAAVLPPDAPAPSPVVPASTGGVGDVQAPKKRGRPPKTSPAAVSSAADTSPASNGPPTAAGDSSTPAASPKAVEPAPAGVVILLDCAPFRSNGEKRLEDYVDEMKKHIEKEFDVIDLRLGDNSTPLAFGKWKGALATLIKDTPPKPGTYLASGIGDLMFTAIETLAPMAGVQIIKGVR